MSTEHLRKASELNVRPIPPTTDWNSIGGTVLPQSQIAPIYFGGEIFAFAQSATNTLTLCNIDSSNTPTWYNYTYTANSSPAVAVARTSPDFLGVACLISGQAVQITYISPASLPRAQTQCSVTGGLDRGTVFAGPLQLVLSVDNRLEVFALDTAGKMWSAYELSQVAPATVRWSSWRQIPWPKLDNSAHTFQALLVTSGKNKNCIAVVSLGSDGKMYQAVESKTIGTYNDFLQVGDYTDLSSLTHFIWGPAALFDSAAQYMVYAAYNQTPLPTNSSLDYYFEQSASSKWEAILPQNIPVPPEAPVLLTNAGRGGACLVWASGSGQVYLKSRTASNWSATQEVGTVQRGGTLNLSAVPNDGKMGLFQPITDGTVAYINYSPS